MSNIKHIITFEFNAVETEVFKRCFADGDTYHYEGNYPFSPAFKNMLHRQDVILINVHPGNYRNCTIFMKSVTQLEIRPAVYFVTNTYFDLLVTLVTATPGSQVLIKPLRKGSINRLIDQRFSMTGSRNDLFGNAMEYQPFVMALLKADESEISHITLDICQYLVPDNIQDDSETLSQQAQKCKNFASLYTCQISGIVDDPKASELTELYSHFVKMISEQKSPEALREALLFFLKDCYTQTHPGFISMDQERVRILKERIIENVRAGLLFSLEDIAKEMHLSISYLSRLFYKVEHQNYKDFILNLRLDRACNMLKNTTQTIEEIALTCGYRESSSFSRAFKTSFGISPSNYRKQTLLDRLEQQKK